MTQELKVIQQFTSTKTPLGFVATFKLTEIVKECFIVITPYLLRVMTPELVVCTTS